MSVLAATGAVGKPPNLAEDRPADEVGNELIASGGECLDLGGLGGR
jgi:hypothetical protein